MLFYLYYNKTNRLVSVMSGGKKLEPNICQNGFDMIISLFYIYVS